MEKLFWVDCEMTGLNHETDQILEIAIIITDMRAQNIYAKHEWTIHQPQEILQQMDDWCTKQHMQSGLCERSIQSKLTYQDVAKELMEILQKHTISKKTYLAGNSVYNDLIFIKKHLPMIAEWMHYRIVDISSIKVLINTWYPNNSHVTFYKQKKHKALLDIQESIAELQHYKKHFFIAE